MKRTTLKLDDAILRTLKQRAAAEGTTMQDLANQLLRRGLAAPSHSSHTLTMTGWTAVTQQGVDILDRDRLFDLMDGR